ncbi:MAG: energy transducer TonB [Deltaproteobacteria bacterium]
MPRFNLKTFFLLSMMLHTGMFAAVSGVLFEPEAPIVEAKPIKVGIIDRVPGGGMPKIAESPPPVKPVEKKVEKKKVVKKEKKQSRRIISRPAPADVPSEQTFTIAESEADTAEPQPTETSSGNAESISGDKGDGGGAPTESGFPDYGLNPKPEYPMLARRNGYQGVVVLRVFVLDSGSVGRVQLEKSSGYRVLDKSALDAVRDWVFIPGKRNGAVISSWVTVPIRFQLSDG